MMDSMESLAELRERREFECRLTPSRALASLDEAEDFLRDRGMLTRTADCAVPSLYEACHEESYQPGGKGFASWPATKWPWFSLLGDRGHPIVMVHRGKNLLVSADTARLLDPICRAEIERMRACDQGSRRLLDHLAQAGPSNTEDLCTELNLNRQELKALRARLERGGAIVSYSPLMTREEHGRPTELARWDQVHPSAAGEVDPVSAFGDFITAAVRSAVVAPEREVGRWFSWQWYWTDTLIDDLARAGRLRRINAHVTTA
jgi:hypothetical protein